jgi:hypothetical protein
MRQGQQNRRGRGRHHNNNNGHGQHNRKGQNPLTRSYESNGPEVKIRGNPAHIAEKYISLARDAQSSGDPVLAENYLQHAEHYNRIILAYREQQIQQGGFDPNIPRVRAPGESDEGESGEFGAENPGGADVQMRGQEPQPATYEGNGPAPASQGFSGQGGERYGGQHQQHRSQRFDDRGPRRHGGDGGRDYGGGRDQGSRHFDQGRNRDRDRDHRRFDNDRLDRGERGDRPPRVDRDRPAPEPVTPEAAPAAESATGAGGGGLGGRRPRDRFAETPAHEQPEFLRRPVRRPRRESSTDDGGAAPEGDERE